MSDQLESGGHRSFFDWTRNPWTGIAFAVYCTVLAVAMLSGHLTVPHAPTRAGAVFQLVIGLGWVILAYWERSNEVTG